MTNSEARWMVPEAEAAVIIGPTGQADTKNSIEPSPYEYLLRALESHISSEREALARYRQLAEATNDPVVELIMGIVLEDEERHHSLMRRIAARLKDDLDWSQSPEALPAAGPTADRSTYEALRAFVASERAGIRELEDFAGRADGLYGGLPTELLEMMVFDSEKHEHLLRFLFRRLGQGLTEAERSA
jgi:rubrerythrin